MFYVGFSQNSKKMKARCKMTKYMTITAILLVSTIAGIVISSLIFLMVLLPVFIVKMPI